MVMSSCQKVFLNLIRKVQFLFFALFLPNCLLIDRRSAVVRVDLRHLPMMPQGPADFRWNHRIAALFFRQLMMLVVAHHRLRRFPR